MNNALKLGLGLQDAITDIKCKVILIDDLSAKVMHIREDVDKYEKEPQLFLWDNGREIRLVSELMYRLVEELEEICLSAGANVEQLIHTLRGEVNDQCRRAMERGDGARGA